MTIDQKQMRTAITTAAEKLDDENPSAAGALPAAGATPGLRFLADRWDDLEARLNAALAALVADGKHLRR